MIKSCTFPNCGCVYFCFTSGSSCGCSYSGYCDYQVPKDSRVLPINKEENKE